MIVDTKADLNVYLETGEDGEKKGAEGCCAPVTEAGEACGDTGVASDTAATGSGCCVPPGVVPEKTDLNEFVGKWMLIVGLNRG
jgi:hypothetical protein